MPMARYDSMFLLCGVGGCSALLIPIAIALEEHGSLDTLGRDMVCCSRTFLCSMQYLQLVFVAGFLFFVLTTPPKIGARLCGRVYG